MPPAFKRLPLTTSALACLCLGTAGCQGGSVHVQKTRGVYTTLAPATPSLDLPAAAYQAITAFGPGQVPAAVVVGYGSRGRPELVTLELRDTATGRPLSQKDYYASQGKAVVQPLLIRSGGAYTVRLVVDGVEHDTCRFTVERSGPTPVLNGPR